MKVHGDFGDVIPLVARLDSPIALCCMYIYICVYIYLISEELQFFYRNKKCDKVNSSNKGGLQIRPPR